MELFNSDVVIKFYRNSVAKEVDSAVIDKSLLKGLTFRKHDPNQRSAHAIARCSIDEKTRNNESVPIRAVI